ncbi:DNA pilot protein [Apis mellifera associated microvirus 58]|nr:DNA pilot protein [Apis mellifera associated microvirus 58]
MPFQQESSSGNEGAGAAGIMGLLSGFIGSGLQNAFNKKRDADAWNRYLYSRDYENWYNSPLEQRKRFEAAGFNPMMMQGGSMQNTMSPQRIPELSPRKAPELGNPILDYVNASSSMAQTNVETKKLDLMDQELRNKRLTEYTIGYNNMLKALEVSKGTDLYQTSLDAARSLAKKIENEARLTGLKGDYQENENFFMLGRNQKQQRLMDLKIEAQQIFNRNYGERLNADLQQIYSRIGLNVTQRGVLVKTGSLLDAKVITEANHADLLQLKKAWQQFENEHKSSVANDPNLRALGKFITDLIPF